MQKPNWLRPNSTNFSTGNGRTLDFCDEKCMLVFFKGRKYWNNKRKLIEVSKSKT